MQLIWSSTFFSMVYVTSTRAAFLYDELDPFDLLVTVHGGKYGKYVLIQLIDDQKHVDLAYRYRS